MKGIDGLDQIVEENIGKKYSQMKEFFQSMVNKGELKAYFVLGDQTTIEKDNEEERIIRIKKGPVLKPVQQIGDQPVLLEEPATGTRYRLCITVEEPGFDDDSEEMDHDNIYHKCILEKINKETDLKRLGDISYPLTNRCDARLVTHYIIYQDDTVGKSFFIEGEQDKLFKKVYEFIKSEHLPQEKESAPVQHAT